ncbi:MAG: hypothetical protein KM296_00065 [Brockia lithotrophica]|nr:hypothetical protein [Brockia lithotrophica]
MFVLISPVSHYQVFERALAQHFGKTQYFYDISYFLDAVEQDEEFRDAINFVFLGDFYFSSDGKSLRSEREERQLFEKVFRYVSPGKFFVLAHPGKSEKFMEFLYSRGVVYALRLPEILSFEDLQILTELFVTKQFANSVEEIHKVTSSPEEFRKYFEEMKNRFYDEKEKIFEENSKRNEEVLGLLQKVLSSKKRDARGRHEEGIQKEYPKRESKDIEDQKQSILYEEFNLEIRREEQEKPQEKQEKREAVAKLLDPPQILKKTQATLRKGTVFGFYGLSHSGRTSLAILFALSLLLEGKRVAFVDADSVSQVASRILFGKKIFTPTQFFAFEKEMWVYPSTQLEFDLTLLARGRDVVVVDFSHLDFSTTVAEMMRHDVDKKIFIILDSPLSVMSSEHVLESLKHFHAEICINRYSSRLGARLLRENKIACIVPEIRDLDFVLQRKPFVIQSEWMRDISRYFLPLIEALEGVNISAESSFAKNLRYEKGEGGKEYESSSSHIHG